MKDVHTTSTHDLFSLNDQEEPNMKVSSLWNEYVWVFSDIHMHWRLNINCWLTNIDILL